MPSYLAVDFGTTNCLAGVVSSSLTLDLVPLDNGKPEMPSAIFLRDRLSRTTEFDKVDFERRCAERISLVERQAREARENIESQLLIFKDINRPRLRDENRVYTSRERKIYKFVDRSIFSKAVTYFDNVQVEQERQRLFKLLPKFKTNVEIESEIELDIILNTLQTSIDILKEETFFSALNNPSYTAIFGSSALDEYLKNPSSGFFMRSPKAFLAARLTESQRELFIRAVSLILGYIKKTSETYFAKTFDGAIIGCPINFMGANEREQNDQALDILRNAAVRVGFKVVRFIYEPLAASLVLPQSIYDSTEPAMIIDVGGGTTDVAYLDVLTEPDPQLKVSGVAGQRVGGNDFDEAITLRKFKPYLNPASFAHQSLFLDAIATRDIHSQAKFLKSGKILFDVLKKNPDDVSCRRLFYLYVNQLQHQLLMFSESLKISLSKQNSVDKSVSFLPPNFLVDLSNDEIKWICDTQFAAIGKLIFEATRNVDGVRACRVYLTGGMSGFPPLVEYIRSLLPKGSTIRRLPALTSIIAGLSVVAKQLSMNHNVLDEPSYIRGVAVLR